MVKLEDSNSLDYLNKTARLIWGYEHYPWQAVSKLPYNCMLFVTFSILQINYIGNIITAIRFSILAIR